MGGHLQNAADITSALDALGQEAIHLTDGRRLIDELTIVGPDLVWICSGGIQGYDPARHLPALPEANHRPVLTRTSLFANAARLAGIGYHELIRDSVGLAARASLLTRPGDVPRARRRTGLRLR